MEERARLEPVPLDGPLAHTERFGSLGNGEPSVEAELHDANEPLVEPSETLHRLLELHDLLDSRRLRRMVILQGRRGSPAAAFLGELRAGVVDEDAPHRSRRDGEEVHAILEAPTAPAGEPKVRLVHDRRRSEGARPAASEMEVGDSPEVVVEDVEEAIPVGAATAAGAGEQVLDLFGGSHSNLSGPTGDGRVPV